MVELRYFIHSIIILQALHKNINIDAFLLKNHYEKALVRFLSLVELFYSFSEFLNLAWKSFEKYQKCFPQSVVANAVSISSIINELFNKVWISRTFKNSLFTIELEISSYNKKTAPENNWQPHFCFIKTSIFNIKW